jgi:hypothetical protein
MNKVKKMIYQHVSIGEETESLKNTKRLLKLELMLAEVKHSLEKLKSTFEQEEE